MSSFSHFIQGFILQHGVHALNSADAHLAIAGHKGRLEPLHGVELGKFAIVVVGQKGHKLLLSLLPQVFSIHQKQNALGLGMLEQAIHRGNGGKGFARTGGHLHQGTGPVSLQAGF